MCQLKGERDNAPTEAKRQKKQKAYDTAKKKWLTAKAKLPIDIFLRDQWAPHMKGEFDTRVNSRDDSSPHDDGKVDILEVSLTGPSSGGSSSSSPGSSPSQPGPTVSSSSSGQVSAPHRTPPRQPAPTNLFGTPPLPRCVFDFQTPTPPRKKGTLATKRPVLTPSSESSETSL
eukprot:TRINITY_DN66259_c1_g1_i3.p1 TRINITY_DN66259_c1_g1~~TRINITY_DN66259_c1_g1_i3.p1  ORF type:complete len:173 (+),score=32.83 TRINITY_DN66259_c1_g1_i3:499-1017(+)